MSVIINKFEETKCFLYNEKEELVGEIKSDLELNDVRIQIMKQKLEGYYILWPEKNRIIPINSSGRLEEWPVGFYDIGEKQLYTLIGWEFKNKKELE